MAARASIQIADGTLQLSGVLDFESVLAVNSLGQQWLESSAPVDCRLDLAQVTYSSSVGIALLLGWLRVAQKQKKNLHIVNLPATMAALARVGGLENILKIN